MHWALILILGLEATPVEKFQSEDLCRVAAEQIVAALAEQRSGRAHGYVCVRTSN